MARVAGPADRPRHDDSRTVSGPLLYEPGMGWEYSPSIDFVGLMVERVSGAGNLQAYMEREREDDV